MTDSITLYLSDFRYNAGLVGLIHALGIENVMMKDNQVQFPAELLNQFEEKYFSYLIQEYGDLFSRMKIVKFRYDFIDKHESTHYNDFNESDLAELNSQIAYTKSKIEKSSSYLKSYPHIESNLNVVALSQSLKKIKVSSKKNYFEENIAIILGNVKERISIMKQIIFYCESSLARKYIGSRDVMYNVVKNGWQNVSFLNKQNKETDSYKEFREYFLEPCEQYLKTNHDNYQWKCCTCFNPIKSVGTKNSLSFLNETGHDVGKKNSHSWDFSNDLGICPICRLVYACLPLGFTYVYDQGVFINETSSVEELFRANQEMKLSILEQPESSDNRSRAYIALVRSLQKERLEHPKVELSDIQLIEYNNKTYHFNILSRNNLALLWRISGELNNIMGATYVDGKEIISIYAMVLSKIWNHENLYLFINKLCQLLLIRNIKKHYYVGQIRSIIKINEQFIGGLKQMTPLTNTEIKEITSEGQKFRKAYRNKAKFEGIVQNLLKALKLGQQEEFTNILLNSYCYLEQSLPKFFNKIFTDEDKFKSISYCFISGALQDGK